jgi:hypothetical protein
MYRLSDTLANQREGVQVVGMTAPVLAFAGWPCAPYNRSSIKTL